ncbi:VUT family protein [Saccharothrix sp. NRRL B-16348]|uniref:VUT family protein n=1 Tax=Saccharothrix sp. NRRL B-16348 TaxID=1415542 RepID=UPI001E578B4C|nr:VUT family protein [Saccharothrix sp. NRRL B-16348]
MSVVAVLAGYLVAVVAANIASVHWPPLIVGGMLLPAGTLFVGAGLTLRDLVHDRCGALGVTAGILAGAGLSALFASPRIAVACVVAFTVSEVLDTLVYTRLRHRTRTTAVAASNAAGLVVDSVLFVPLAFGGVAALPGQITGKAVATILTLTALHTAQRRRRTART